VLKMYVCIGIIKISSVQNKIEESLKIKILKLISGVNVIKLVPFVTDDEA
jgi:hypothetical protein